MAWLIANQFGWLPLQAIRNWLISVFSLWTIPFLKCSCSSDAQKGSYISLHMQNRWIHFKISSKANWDFNSEKWKFMNRNLYAVYYWHSRKTNNSFVQISWRQSCMRRWRRRLVDIWSFLTKFLTFQDQGYLSRFKIPTKKRGLFFRFWENSLCCRLLFFLFSCFP